jgi:GNAT superfamily N-acetyltransferase
MEISLRPVRDDDREFLAALYASTRTEELAVVPWTEEQKAAFLRSQFEAQDHHYRSNYEDTTFDVIVVDGERAGRLYVARWPSELRIVDISLAPPFRGRGIGSRFLAQVITEAERAQKPLTIHVERNNPALRLYQRLGFRPVEDKGIYLLLRR